MHVTQSITKTCRLLSLLLLTVGGAGAQVIPVMDGNPTSVRWNMLRTRDFRIIFPQGFDQQANRVANTLQSFRLPGSRTIGTPSFRRMPVVLQNRSSISNGFVTLAPLRSEFFTMPTQNYNFLGNNDWLDLLTVHEYRHMAQFRHSTRGFNRLFYYLFGQEALASMSYLSVPPWFWEGDAVATETAFTHSGRGRIPNFDMVLRTNFLEGRTFRYDKNLLRSYRHYIPNHYVLGYHMVSYLREAEQSADVWDRVTRRTWSVPFLPMRFSNSIRKESGLSVGRLFRNMAAERGAVWKQQADTLHLTPFEVLSVRSNRTYTDYAHPQFLQDGRLVALKSGLSHIQQLVLLDSTREEKLFATGVINESGMLSASGSQVIWNEYRFDPRWPARSWSVLRYHDNDSGRFHSRQLTHRSRYGGAALSPDGKKIVTVESKEDYTVQVVVLDFFTRKILKRLTNPSGAFYAMMRWDDTGQNIVGLRTKHQKKEVVLIHAESGAEHVLLPAESENIGNPVIWKDHLFFNGAAGGIDNIFALHIPSGKRYQVTTARYGAYDACVSPNGKWIAYTNQSADGLDVVRMPFQPWDWTEVAASSQPVSFVASHLAEQEGRPDILDSIPDLKYESRPYRRVLRMLKPHSWGGYVATDLTRASIGITSRDLLGTLSVYGGYEYDIQERTGNATFRASLQALYPILDVSYTSGERNVQVADELEFIQSVSGSDTTFVRQPLSFSWKEESREAGFRIPLNLTASSFFTQLNFSGTLGRTDVRDFTNSFDQGGRLISREYPQYFFRSYQDNGRLLYGRFGLTAYNLMRRSERDINSRWGQALFVQAWNSIPGSDFTGTQSSVTGYLYFPGLLRNHSLWGYWAYQDTRIDWRDRADYTFRNQIPLPRGASVSRFEKMYAMSANYTLPLVYPDLHIGPLVNLRRIRMNGFADYAFGNNPGLATITRTPQSTAWLSAGMEMRLDMNFLRLMPEFDIGVRVSQVVLPGRDLVVELLLGTVNF